MKTKKVSIVMSLSLAEVDVVKSIIRFSLKKNTVKIIDEKLQVIYDADPQKLKSFLTELTDRFKNILTSAYNHEIFLNFTEDLRKFTQNKQS